MMHDWLTFGIKMAFPPSDTSSWNNSAYLAPTVWLFCQTFVISSTISFFSFPFLTDRPFVLRKSHPWNVCLCLRYAPILFLFFTFCEKTKNPKKHRWVLYVDVRIILGCFADPSDRSVIDFCGVYCLHIRIFAAFWRVRSVLFTMKCSEVCSPVKHHYSKSIPTDMAA